MKTLYQWTTIASAAACFFVSGCSKKSGDVWDDTKSANSYNSKSDRTLWGNEEGALAREDLIGPNEEDFIALQEEDLKSQFADGAIPQPKAVPGEEGSGLPGIDQFSGVPSHLASVFRTLYFNTDDHILRGKESLSAVEKISAYLKEHPHTYIFIAGHCDERGPEAYNLSLGARRANYIRSLLVQKGVDLNQIHTISYGKELPAAHGNNPDAWAKNRRAEFKIYQK